VVNIGTRQKGREHGSNVATAVHCRHEILAAIDAQIVHGPYPSDRLYGDGNAGRRIANVISDVALTYGKRLTY
jgi:hypothetical protein